LVNSSARRNPAKDQKPETYHSAFDFYKNTSKARYQASWILDVVHKRDHKRLLVDAYDNLRDYCQEFPPKSGNIDKVVKSVLEIKSTEIGRCQAKMDDIEQKIRKIHKKAEDDILKALRLM
jgi:pyoverdine/dityrosine biosynthesis protein Dit1